MSNQKKITILVNQLKKLKEIKAICLVGSQASGAARVDSDIDISILYDDKNVIDINQIRNVIKKLSNTPNPYVSEVGEWGKLANGRAWFYFDKTPVNIFYWDIDQIISIIEESKKGIISSTPMLQPPFGFYNFCYLGILKDCKKLYDPNGYIIELKKKVNAYPKILKLAIIKTFSNDIKYCILNAKKYVKRKQIYPAIGCFLRIISNLLKILYALNEEYFIADKRIYFDYPRFKIKPKNFIFDVNRLLRNITEPNLKNKLSTIQNLTNKVTLLYSQTD